MLTVTEHIRKRLEKCIGKPAPTLEDLRRSEWSREFIQLMRNRLLMGAFRYGLLVEKRMHNKYDMIGSLKRRIEMYEETGNMEYMVDAANLCMLEFECPSHKNPSWEATDDGEHCK